MGVLDAIRETLNKKEEKNRGENPEKNLGIRRTPLNRMIADKISLDEPVHVTPDELRSEGYVLGVDPRNSLPRSLPIEERNHSLLVGKSGMGKSTFILSQALQDVERNESVVIIDPHGGVGGLVWKFLSHLPKEKWDKVIYFNPITARDQERVVELNFLEPKEGIPVDLTKELFINALEKNYPEFWGPRLENILDHSLMLLYNVVHCPTIRELGDCVANRNNSRSKWLAKCTDEEVSNFWAVDFKAMPPESYTSVLNKIYKIMTSSALRPIARARQSTMDLYEAINEGKIIVAELPSGKLTEGIAGFLGSLLLSRLYQVGMMRDKIPEDKRKPVHIYVDEAHRFITRIIQDNMRTLRKFGIYLTAASQNLNEYEKWARNELPELADTIIAFRSGKNTAQQIEEDFSSRIGKGRGRRPYQSIMKLPNYCFYVSVPVGGKPEVYFLETIDVGEGSKDPREVIDRSLAVHGKEYRKERLEAAGLPAPTTITPVEYFTLHYLAEVGEDLKKNVWKVMREMYGKYNFDKSTVQLTLDDLINDGYVYTHIESEDKRDAPDGRNPYCSLTKKGRDLIYPELYGKRVGGSMHITMMCNLIKYYRSKKYMPVPVDPSMSKGYEIKLTTPSGELTSEDNLDAYPDLLVYPIRSAEMWNMPRGFAVEVEAFPTGARVKDIKTGRVKGTGAHLDRTVNHFFNARDRLKVPVVFAVRNERDKKAVERRLRGKGAKPVHDIVEESKPSNIKIRIVSGEVGEDENLQRQVKDSCMRAHQAQINDAVEPEDFEGEELSTDLFNRRKFRRVEDEEPTEFEEEEEGPPDWREEMLKRARPTKPESESGEPGETGGVEEPEPEEKAVEGKPKEEPEETERVEEPKPEEKVGEDKLKEKPEETKEEMWTPSPEEETPKEERDWKIIARKSAERVKRLKKENASLEDIGEELKTLENEGFSFGIQTTRNEEYLQVFRPGAKTRTKTTFGKLDSKMKKALKKTKIGV